jgi:hypothetical protein
VIRGGAHEVAPLGWAEVLARIHARELRLERVGGAPVRQAGDNGPADEGFRIDGEHDRRHRPTGRQTGDIHPLGIDGVLGLHLIDHLPDRQRLASIPGNVTQLEPVEASEEVVRELLLRQQQGEAARVRECGPAGLVVVGSGALRAAVQCHDQGRRGLQSVRDVHEHPKAAGIRPETSDLGQGRRPGAAACTCQRQSQRCGCDDGCSPAARAIAVLLRAHDTADSHCQVVHNLPSSLFDERSVAPPRASEPLGGTLPQETLVPPAADSPRACAGHVAMSVPLPARTRA